MTSPTTYQCRKLSIWKSLALLFPIFWLMPGGQSLFAQHFINVAVSNEIEAGPQGFYYGETASFMDVNGDGWDDLTIARSNDSLRVYLSGPDGFTLAPAPIQCPANTLHVLWVDYDNDGDLDLYITVMGGVNRLFQNNGTTPFTDVTVAAGLVAPQAFNYGASFGDFDRDGHLDLYVCRYYAAGDVTGKTNLLYHSNGDGTFTDVTDSLGVGDGFKASFMGVWADFNNDLWPDLFVINDREPPNTLFINTGNGSFEDITDSSATGYPFNDPMSATIGDYNNDGFLDIFMSNGGNLSNMPPLLLTNNGDETFSESGSGYGIVSPWITWGASWIDYDNDGWRDLFFCTSDNTPSYLYKNEFGAFFSNQSNQVLAPSGTSYVCSVGDFNNDGYADILVQNRFPELPFLLENQNEGNHYVKFNLTGTVSNTDAIGAWIHVHRGGDTYHHYTMCGENFKGQNSQNILFGLGDSDAPLDSVVVEYPSGHIDIYYQVPVDTLHYLVEGETYGVEVLANGETSFCSGDSLELSTSNTHSFYQWSTGDTTQTLVVGNSGTYVVAVGNSFGITASDSIEITVYPPPSISIAISHPACHGDSTGSISLENQAGTGISSVVWASGLAGSWIDSLSAGTFSYELVDLNGCTDIGEATLIDPPQLVVVIFVNDEQNGNDGQIFVSVFGGSPPYQISLNGVPFDVLIEGLAGGIYMLEVEDSNGCVQVFETEVGSLLGTSSSKSGEAMKLHPNPTAGMLYYGGKHHIGSVRVVDMQGKTVLQSAYTGNGTTDGSIDLSPLAPGAYMAHFTFDHGENLVRKVVKK